MKRSVAALAMGTLLLLTSGSQLPGTPPPKFRDLFNGKDLTGWVNVNTDPDTWSLRDGLLVCKGKSIGVMRSDKQYENFVLHIEWRHMEPGGNSGVFVWNDAKPDPRTRLPNGVEMRMLELESVKLHTREDRPPPPVAYVHGELFGVSIENLFKGRGEWNTYQVVAVDGTAEIHFRKIKIIKLPHGVTSLEQSAPEFD